MIDLRGEPPCWLKPSKSNQTTEPGFVGRFAGKQPHERDNNYSLVFRTAVMQKLRPARATATQHGVLFNFRNDFSIAIEYDALVQRRKKSGAKSH
jgi:hypothetical protein